MINITPEELEKYRVPRKIFNIKESEQPGMPNRIELDIDKLREAMKSMARLPDETFEDYKARMRDINKACKLVMRGRLVYDSSNMVPYKVS